ncbi:hypothetical protein HDU76_001059 [Blyttiomyces sp. JEL0837]|nr:hypothetical protein HDU76_001059 [Blyttiomyces sp. JEL0837]
MSAAVPFSSFSRPGADDNYDDEDDDSRMSVQSANRVEEPNVSFTTVAPIVLQDPGYWGEEPVVTEQARDQQNHRLIAEYFPEFANESHIKFSDLFIPKVVRTSKPVKRVSKRGRGRDHGYSLGRDNVDEFYAGGNILETKADFWGYYRSRRAIEDVEEREIFAKWNVPPSLQAVGLDSWEKQIMWSADQDDQINPSTDSVQKLTEAGLIRNYSLDTDKWTDAIVWDDEIRFIPPPFTIDDPTILNDLKFTGGDVEGTSAAIATKMNLMASLDSLKSRGLFNDITPQMKADPFNMSNDHFYETLLKREHVRQTHSTAILQHSLPAIMLAHPYYKTQPSTRDLRSFHRPQMKFPLKTELHFSRVKNPKKKKEKLRGDKELLEEIESLTLKDNSQFVLLEYSEEYPPIVSNFGMGSLIQNYYRKTEEKDSHTPTFNIGQLIALDKVDATPFLTFGDVEPGQAIQAVTNNLIRAPIFNHKSSDNDFLLIRYTYQQKVRYYLRGIEHLFTVGQTYPLMEVPRPQSRKITNTMKGRLQVIAYRMMRNNPNQRLWYPKLTKYYVGQQEGQLKQRLKEFAQFWKKGENTGWWKLKPGKVLPLEEEIQKLVPPEIVCLFESAMAGEQRLRDIGYVNIDFREENEEDDANADIEVQMAPWTTTKNFRRGMLKLFGDGDPTGRGEGFSFIKQSMKVPFYRQGDPVPEKPDPSKPKVHTKFSYTEQDVIYREEIKRIWNAQLRALSCETPPDLGDEGEEDIEAMGRKKRQLEISEENERKTMYGYDEPASPPPMSPPAISVDGKDTYSDVEDDVMSVSGSVTSNPMSKKNKRLVINRLIRSPEGVLEWKPEIISDIRVINAYLRQRKLIESQIAGNSETPIGASEEDVKKQRRKRTQDHIIKLKQKSSSKKVKRREKEKDASAATSRDESTPQPLKLKIPLAGLGVSATSQTVLKLKRESKDESGQNRPTSNAGTASSSSVSTPGGES